MGIFKYLSISRKSLKYKLIIAFSIMSIIPVLILTYFVTNYVFENSEDMFQASAIVIFCLWLIWIGYVMVSQILKPIMELAQEAKLIADGDYNSKVLLSRDDELGEIADAVNSMTGKMRTYIGELQEYSKRTASLNVKIHRKVITLTNLMRLGEIISSGAAFDEITAFAAERLAGEMYRGFCAIFVKEDMSRYSLRAFVDNSHKGLNITDIESRLSMIEDLMTKHDYLSIDSDPLRKPWQQELRQKLGQMNAVFFPMRIKTNIVGIILAGTFGEDIRFSSEDVEVIRAFDNELVLGYQNTVSADKIQSLEAVDRVTGLYSFHYLKERLEDEINRAIFYQRPCSLVIVDLDDFAEIASKRGEDAADRILLDVSRLLSELRPPIGKVARFGRGEFALLLPEMNKREGLDVGENIRAKVGELSIAAGHKERLTASVGAGENPIDGSTADEVIEKARVFVRKAREQGGNRVVGE